MLYDADHISVKRPNVLNIYKNLDYFHSHKLK